MLVEAFVLNVDCALKHVLANLVFGDAVAVLHVEHRDLVVVGIQDRGGLGGKVGVGVGIVRKIGQPTRDIAHHAHGKGDAADQHEPEERAQDDGDGMCLGAGACVSLARTHGVPPVDVTGRDGAPRAYGHAYSDTLAQSASIVLVYPY